MYNDYDQMNDNNDDMDRDIQERQALLEEAKNLEEGDNWADTQRSLTSLKRRWRRIPSSDSIFEQELETEFEACLDKFYAKRKELYKSNQEAKEALIQKTEALSTSTEWGKTSHEMNDLLAQWKTIPSCGRDLDEELWQKFSAARQKFFDAKRSYWADIQGKMAEALEKKEELIKKAGELANSKDWQKTNTAFKHLMDEWKACGSAGKEHENRLWNEFNTSRQTFYENRNAYYDALHETQAANYASKQALVGKAQDVLDTEEYTKSNTETMKELGKEWKTVGSCGKDKEDQIWNAFRSIMDDYFAGLKKFNEERQAQWRQRQIDARARKLDLIEKQNRTIKRLENEMVGMLGQRSIDEAQERIEDCKEFISRLEEEIQDINKRLGE